MVEGKMVSLVIPVYNEEESLPRLIDRLRPVMDGLKMDKKKRDDVIHFVLIRKIGMPFVNGGIADGMIRSVLEGMRA